MTSVSEHFHASPFQSKKHSGYFPAYDVLLSGLRDRPITFVEIGVLNGGSLFMWRSYFGDQARIIGIDLNPAAKRWEQHGFEIFVGNQADTGFWSETMKKIGDIDVLLDDGGHTFAQQIVTCEAALPHIKDGGILIIEDTHSSYMPDFGGPSARSLISYAKNIVDGVNYRSGRLPVKIFEQAVFYVSFFESIVAFHVDRTVAAEKSVPVVNAGETMAEIDYRFSDSQVGWAVESATRRYIGLRNLPVIGPILEWTWKRLRVWILWVLSRKAALGLGRYFKY
jgi:hypothetical protein